MKKSKTIAFLLALFMLLPNFNGVVYAAETALPAEKAIEGEGVIKGDKKVFKIDPNTVEKAMKTESKSNRHATSLYRAPEEETNTEIRLTTHGLNGEPFDWSVFENNEFNVTFSYTDNNGQLQEITSQTIEERNGGSIECYVKWPLQGMKAAQIETDFDENYDVRADCEPSNGEGNAGKIIFYLDVYELPNTNLKVEYKEIYGRDLRDNLPSDSDEAPNFKLSLGEGVVIPLPKKGTEVNLRDFETVEEELGEDAADDLVDNMETSILNALETLPITIDDNAEGTYTFGTGDAAKLYKYQINQASKADPSVIRLTYTPDIAVPQKSDGQYPPVPDGYVRLTFDANGENGLQGTFSDGQSVKHMDVKSSLKYDDEELQKQIKNLRATATENGITYTQSEATPWEPEVPTEGNVTTGTYTAKYAKSDATVIPYEPTDPDKPTSPDDKNIPTQDKDGNTVDKTNYVQVAFKVSPEETGLLNLGNVKNQVISALVKKDTTWDDVTLPTTTGQNDYVFWHWDKAEGNVTEGQVRVAKFVKDGDDITGDDTKLPDGYFSVALEKGEGIRDNALFGKTYAVKSDSKLAEDKFPNLEAQDNFKEPAWNVKNPWDQIITDHTTFTASAVSSVFDKNNVTIIEVTTQPKISYTEGEQLDLTGLVATLTDKNGNKQEVTFEDLGDYGITANPTNGTELTVADHHDKPIVLTKDTLTVSTNKLTVVKPDSNETVIPYEPSDPKNPTDENDPKIPKTDKDGNVVNKDNFVQVAFKVSPEESGLLRLENVENQVISALVKKDTTWDDVTLPTATGQNNYVFWHWDKVEGNVAEGQVRVAKFVKDGDDITGDDTKLPDGYFSVALEKGEGIQGSAFFGKTYAVKSDSKLAEDKFPELVAEQDYKDPKWNVENPWDQAIKNNTTFTASAVSSVFDKNNVTSIEVTTQPKTGYTEGEKLDLTGLVAILTDKNGNKQEVTFEDLGDYEITANPTNGTELTVADHDNKPITLTKGDLTAYTDKLTISERASSSAPEVIQPIEGDKAINGTGETGATIVVTNKDGEELGTATVGEDGTWSVNIPADKELTAGDTISITQMESGKKPTTIKESVAERASSSAPEVIQPIEGNKAINGTGETGATIVVTNKDGEELGTATVGEDGKWTVNVPADKELTAGDTISITQTESGKKPTTITESVAERASSSAPEVIQPIEGDKAINGTGETGATIVVTNKDGEELGTATVGEDGTWSVNIPADKELTAGDTISITQTESGKKPTTITETIEERASSSVPEVTQPIEGDKVIKGNGVSDATIQVTLPGMDDPIETTVGEDGKWTVNVPADKELTAGDTISVTQTETGKKPITTEVTVETKPHVQKPSSPAVDPVTEGDSVIRVTPPSDGDRIAVTLPDGSTVVVNKDDDGNWKTEGGTAVPTEDGKLQIPVDGDKVVPGGKGVDVTVTDTTTNETSDPTHRDVEAKPEDKTSVNYPNTDIGRGETKVINPTITDKNGDPVKPDAAPTITDAPGHGIVVTPNSDGSLTVQVPEGYKGPSRVTIGVEVTVGGKTLQTEVVVTIEDEDKPIAPPVDHGGNWITLTPIDKDDQSKLEKGEHIAYIYGYPDKTVKPEGMITRAEAAAMISRLADLDRSDTSKPMYVDTPSGWYNRDINAMVKKNLMFGEDGKFRPNEPITRGEFARALYYIDHKSDEVAPFGDVKGHRYEEAINQAYGNGRISGYPDGTFRPDAPIQRAEAARLLNRFAGRSVSERGLIDVRGDVACFDDLSKGHWAYYEIVEASNSHRYVRMNKDNIEEMWTAIMNLVQH